MDGECMRILMVASEMAPFGKTGQVADVVYSLAQALAAKGHDVRVAIPRYGLKGDVKDLGEPLIDALAVPIGDHGDMASVYAVPFASGLQVYLIDNPRYSGYSPVQLYGDEAERVIFHCRAVLECLKHEKINWQPDVIHCHDWQTAIIPNWLATTCVNDPFYADVATVFTLHRLSHQGIFGYRILEVAGLESYGFIYYSGVADLNELVNLMGRGIYYADAITTVSEGYAQEILDPEFGEGLDPLFCEKQGRLFGILNGIDTEAYDPASDEMIAVHYDARSIDRRRDNKLALQNALGLVEVPRTPLVGMVSRLSEDKGFGLLSALLGPLMSQTNLQLVVLGVGEPKYQSMLQEFERRYPGRISVQLTYNETLERQIYAGSDMFLMPSRVEPCGLGQMLAMHYGSVPIVRATGGLRDTVEDFDPAAETGDGIVFQDYDEMALFAALVRAETLYHQRDVWAGLQRRGMAKDLSWRRSVLRYEETYRWAKVNRLRSRV